MEELDSKINLWIRERLIPRLLTENESNAKFTISRPTGSFFISDLFFVTVHSVNSGDKSVVVKLPLRNPDVSVVVEYDGLFLNEILFYNEIGCFHDKDYAKCYLAGDDSIFRNVIVLEDMRPRGYGVTSKKVNVDIDYIIAGLKAIGRFHGHTYAIKEREPARFCKIVQSICKIRYLNDSTDIELRVDMNNRIQRILKALQDKNYDPEFLSSMSKVFKNVYSDLMTEMTKPVEPLATIVHGDCTMNNFLYGTTNDGEMKSILIDYGLLMHSSPAIDVSSFLYMSCKREDIRDRSDELFGVYHDSLMECMKEHGIWDSSKYSREAFWKDYRERVIFGYVGSAVFFRYFLIMYDRDNIIPKYTDTVTNQFFESVEGQNFVDELVNMLDDLKIAGMLDHLILKY